MNFIGSDHGINSCCFGPPLWAFLHMSALNYKPEHAKMYRSFYNSLGGVLPCRACRENYPKNLITAGYTNKRTWSSRKGFFTFVWRLHNAVDDATGSTKLTRPTLEQTARAFERTRAKCGVSRVGGGEGGCTLAARRRQKPLRAEVHFVSKKEGDWKKPRFIAEQDTGMVFPARKRHVA